MTSDPTSRPTARSTSPAPTLAPTMASALALALAALLPLACTPASDAAPSGEDGPPSAAAMAAVRPPATFRGTLPCADCPGIRTTLDLDADGTAMLTRLYVGGEPGRDAPVEVPGRWGVDAAGRLTVATSDGDTSYFAFAREGLSALDREGRPYASSLPRLLERVSGRADDPLTGTAWRFIEPAPVGGGGPAPGLRFSAGRLIGTDGCDEFTGSWSGRDGSVDLYPAFTTRSDCPEPVAAGARAIGSVLDRTAGYRIEAHALVLLDAEGAELARLRPDA